MPLRVRRWEHNPFVYVWDSTLGFNPLFTRVTQYTSFNNNFPYTKSLIVFPKMLTYRWAWVYADAVVAVACGFRVRGARITCRLPGL